LLDFPRQSICPATYLIFVIIGRFDKRFGGKNGKSTGDGSVFKIATTLDASTTKHIAQRIRENASEQNKRPPAAMEK